MIYLDENGVTVKAKSGSKGAKAGEIYELNGKKYYVAIDQYDLQKIVKNKSYQNIPLNRIVTSKITTMNGLFYQWGNDFKDFNEDISTWDTSRVKSMSEMFYGCEKFNQPIGHWDVSKVTATMHMFYAAKSFNQPLADWNTERLDNMSNMFENAESFNQPIENWNMSACNNMLAMFKGASSFNQSLKNWKIGLNTYTSYDGNEYPMNPRMFSLFEDAKSFNGDLSGWRLSGAITAVFKNAEAFNQALDSWDVSMVTSMKSLFEGASSFNQDISNWETSKVTSFENTFYGTSSFNQDISKWSISNATNLTNMFREAKSFNKDISNWDVSNVTKINGLFRDALAFNQNISSWNLNEKIKPSKTIFQNATSFNLEKYSPFTEMKTSKRVSVTQEAVKSLGIELTSDDKKTISKIKKLLIERDYDKIDLGIELLRSLDKKEVYETLLFDCKINTNDYDDFDVFSSQSYVYEPAYGLELIRNKLFTGSEPAQPFLDYALINLIANAPRDAKLDESLNINNISFFDLKLFKLQKLKSPIPIEKFTSLKTLTFNFDVFNIIGDRYDYDYGGDGVNIEDLFGENNINHLKADNVKGSLKWMKNFKQLKSLEFRSISVYKIEDLESFKYLENLEELKIYSDRFDNLDFLINCKNIKKLNLTVSEPGYGANYPEMEFNGKLQNINFLKNLHNLKYLRLSGLIGYEFENFDFSGLYSCKQIKELYMDISDSTDLSELKKCISLESLKLVGGSNDNVDVSANILDINGLKQLKSLKSISTETLSFYGLDNGNLMTDSNSKIIVEKSTKVNVKDVALVENIMRYKGLPFNGTIYKEINEDLFFEFEVVDGFKDGLYREFYLPTGNIKLEILYEKNKINKVVGFYDQNGKNILGKETCISAFDLNSEEVHRIGGEEGGFFYNGNRYTGFCLLDVTIERSFYGRKNNEKLRELIENLKSSNINSDNHIDDKVSLILKLKNGIITKDISVATKDKYTKTSVVNDYDFDNMPSSFDEDAKEAFKKMDKEKQHRLYIYMNSLFDIPIILEDQNQSMNSDKTLDGMSVVISGVFENYSRNELKELIEIKGGKSSSSITKNTSFVLAGDKMGPSKKQKANDLNIEMIGEEEFVEKYVSNQNDNQASPSTISDQILLRNVLNPNDKKSKRDYIVNNKKRPKLTSDDRKSFSEIKKLLIIRDFDKIDEGVQKLVSLNKLELYETLLDGCEIMVDKTNWGISKKLIKNKIFTGSGPAQPYLNYALFSIIANTPEEAEINDTIHKRNLIDLDMSVFDLSALEDKFIPIDKFNLTSKLKLNFKIFEEFNKGAKNINRENWFANNKISDLEVNVSGSLQWMKNFTQLKFLNIEFGYYPVNNIESFEFLENLEELSLKNFNYQQVFKNLDFLQNSKKIKKFSLEIKKSYDATEKLENIDIIKDFIDLTDLEINGIHSSLSLDFLLLCKKIKNLTLSFDQADNGDTNYFELLRNCSSLETLNIKGIDNYNIKGKILNINGLNGLPNLKNFSLNKVNISALDNSIFIN